MVHLLSNSNAKSGIIFDMIGIDIVKIERIKQMMERFGSKAMDRFLCKEEQDLVSSASTAAGFWAVKEAVAKALGCGIGSECSFYDIHIKKSEKNAPYIMLSNRLIERFGIESAEISITHDGGFAVAIVVLYTKEKRKIEGF